MTFYEELGVPPDASPETIRDAYRRVARLLHPDVQTDPTLKESADEQMKRINYLHGILSDPERRRRYDQELAVSAGRSDVVFIPAVIPAAQLRPGNSGTLVWLAATAVCATFIIWLAARESSSTPAVYPVQSAADKTRPASKTPVRPRSAAIMSHPFIPSGPHPAAQRDDELAALRGQLLAANSDRDGLLKKMAVRETETKASNVSKLTPAPLIALQTAPDIAVPAVLPPAAPPSLPRTDSPQPAEPATPKPGTRWTGSWAYHPVRAENRDRALFPPEYIEIVIHEDKGRIRGQYHARYKIAGATISPDVDFRFEGKVSGSAANLRWTGAGGAKGEVKLRLASETTLEIVWSATNLGKSMGLASGTALLNRNNQ
jgi:curved DNA-binding protein CbpA